MAAAPAQRPASETPSRRRILPLVLALTLFIIPQVAAFWLHHEARGFIEQTEAEREYLRETVAVIPIEERTDEQNDMVIDAWVRESELELRASNYRRYAAILHLAGAAMAGMVLIISNRKD